MWDGYFSDLMHGMWAVSGWERDADQPNRPHLEQVPLLREWNECGLTGAHPLSMAELSATAQAFRDAVAELKIAGPSRPESLKHGEALAGSLDQDVVGKQVVRVEQWRGNS